ncbi:hypothetical protein [Nocardia sp. NPDC020380]|uniref:hypothetical protein n=1 Tax=Nocardia sp. NPDC020380 TaxID=3364309 RepID=UPI0037B25D61
MRLIDIVHKAVRASVLCSVGLMCVCCSADHDGPSVLVSSTTAPASARSMPSTTVQPTSSVPVTTSENPVRSTLPGRLAGLLDCGDVKSNYEGPDPDPGLHCVLRAEDHTGLLFEVLGSPAITINVYDTQGRFRQTLRQQVDRPGYEMPFLSDLDGTGRQELLVVTTSGGTGGEDVAVWHAIGDSDRFSFAGTMFGFPQGVQQTVDGFIAIYTHGGAGSGVVTLYRFVDDKLVTLAVLDVEASADPYHPQWQTNGSAKCALDRTSGRTDVTDGRAMADRNAALVAAGIDPATAEEHFCSEPWVGDLYR